MDSMHVKQASLLDKAEGPKLNRYLHTGPTKGPPLWKKVVTMKATKNSYRIFKENLFTFPQRVPDIK